jgi:hypothetical protein
MTISLFSLVAYTRSPHGQPVQKHACEPFHHITAIYCADTRDKTAAGLVIRISHRLPG